MRSLPPASLSRLRQAGQRGVTLIEALVALLVMSFGMLALVGLMSNLRFGADLAKQRSEAMRLARAEISLARDYSELERGAATPVGATVYAELDSFKQPKLIQPRDSNTTYTIDRTVTDLAAGGDGKSVRVSVSWTDRTDTTQWVRLDTVIAKVDPVFSAAVGFTPQGGALTPVAGRNPVIPEGAKQLDKNNSAFRPSALGSTVWVFNNFSGAIVGKCSVPAGTPVSTLTSADVASCNNNTVGLLLSGTVRFSNTNPANPALPEAMAIPLGIDFTSGSYDLPQLDANGKPIRNAQGVIQTDTYSASPPTPTGGNAPNFECFNDSPTSSPSSQPFVNYYCIIYQSTTPLTWSGKVVLTGFSTGTNSTDYRVCRYSADYNESGDMYTADKRLLDNAEHPAVYGKVSASLARQNFLVVRGDRSCPTAAAVNPAGGVFADYSTVQLQP
ncbi:MAG: prepilin-type N-terminal cleavage/methylation domain-containing protein [Pelomonas sp.]|nr:prepilin-type N-terminal cleavage/methylation domain-containing protein [Roseateles sp.]